MNVNKLKGKIIERAMTIEILAFKIGIDKSTLYRKLANDGLPLTIGEACLIKKELDLSTSEAISIFFEDNVA